MNRNTEFWSVLMCVKQPTHALAWASGLPWRGRLTAGLRQGAWFCWGLGWGSSRGWTGGRLAHLIHLRRQRAQCPSAWMGALSVYWSKLIPLGNGYSLNANLCLTPLQIWGVQFTFYWPPKHCCTLPMFGGIVGAPVLGSRATSICIFSPSQLYYIFITMGAVPMLYLVSSSL